MGAVCSKHPAVTQEDAVNKAQDAEISRRIEREAKEEKDVQKLLLLGAGESGKSTIFKQIKVLYQTGFDDAERRSYRPVIHANVCEAVRTLFIGAKEFAESEEERSSNYELQPENKVFGEKLSEVESFSRFIPLTEEIALKVQSFWRDPAVQAVYLRESELQLPDCTQFFLENVLRLAQHDYTPTQEDVLYARQQTKGIVQIEFSPVGNSKRQGGMYRLFDVGGQRNERRKWIHLFDGVTAVIFCASLSEYDQMLFEEETKNRMMETKELFDWLLKEPWFKKTSFLLFLNKFDIFEKKAMKVPLTVCEWFQDYQPPTLDSVEIIDHAYQFIKQKFKDLYNQNTPPDDTVHRIFRIYKTTALDRNLIEQTFQLVNDALARKRLLDEGLL